MLTRLYDWLYRIVKLFRVPIGWVFGTHPELAQLVESGRIEPGLALDLGCGVGREVIYLAQKGFEATGVDISPTAIGMARESAASQGVSARFVVDDLTRLSKLEAPFDLLVDYGALNDLDGDQREGYMRHVLPLAGPDSKFVLMCFEKKLPRSEVEDRFGSHYSIELISSKGEAGFGRTLTTYLMEKETSQRGGEQAST